MNISKQREEFVEQCAEDFLCSICLSVPSPSFAVESTCCGSFFCSPCLSESRRRKEICPNCNGNLLKFPPRIVSSGNKFAQKKLLGLLIYCETKLQNSSEEDKCTWRGAWGDSAAHLAHCEHVLVNCAWNRCAVVASRKNMRTHESVCEFRTISCEFCQVFIPYCELQKHLVVCNRLPIECSCGQLGIVRETRAYHLTYHCPEVLLDCNVEGCPEKVKRKDFTSHTSSCGYHKVGCNLCDANVPRNSLPKHYGIDCPLAVVNCPHACGVAPMLRRDVAAHLYSCPSMPVTCVLGCSAKMLQRDREQHMKESTAEHVQALFHQMSILQEQVRSLSSTVLRHERTITELSPNLRLVDTGDRTQDNTKHIHCKLE